MNSTEKIEVKQDNGIPRREFIQKSLIASGGVFVGMSLGEKMSLPQIHGQSGQPSRSASKSDDDKDDRYDGGEKDRSSRYGGSSGGYRW